MAIKAIKRDYKWYKNYVVELENEISEIEKTVKELGGNFSESAWFREREDIKKMINKSYFLKISMNLAIDITRRLKRVIDYTEGESREDTEKILTTSEEIIEKLKKSKSMNWRKNVALSYEIDILKNGEFENFRLKEILNKKSSYKYKEEYIEDVWRKFKLDDLSEETFAELEKIAEKVLSSISE